MASSAAVTVSTMVDRASMGYLPEAVSPESMTQEVPSNTALATSDDLGPGGAGIADHGVQHLGGGDDRLAGPDGGLDHLLLEDGHLVGGDLHAQIAPGHHDAVGGAR